MKDVTSVRRSKDHEKTRAAWEQFKSNMGYELFKQIAGRIIYDEKAEGPASLPPLRTVICRKYVLWNVQIIERVLDKLNYRFKESIDFKLIEGPPSEWGGHWMHITFTDHPRYHFKFSDYLTDDQFNQLSAVDRHFASTVLKTSFETLYFIVF